jgi:hypothetical protein
MIKRDELADPNSCLNRAQDDEPIFVLRAHDSLADGIVQAWAARYHSFKSLGGVGRLTPQQEAKYHEAHELARAMQRWRIAHPAADSQLRENRGDTA